MISIKNINDCQGPPGDPLSDTYEYTLHPSHVNCNVAERKHHEVIPAKAIYLLATVSDFEELTPSSEHTKLKL